MSRVCPSSLSFMLYNPLRKAFTDRERILDESGITPGSLVLEIGAGNGFMTEAIVRRASQVICIELQEGMVKKLKKRLCSVESKIKIITADIASWNPGALSADVCLLYYTFHEFAQKESAVRVISRAVRNNGIISLYEPTVEVRKHAMQRCISLFEKAGFSKESERHGMFTRFVRFRKKGN